MMKPFFFGLATLTLLVNGLGQANADIIFNDYGPGYTYNTGIGWTVSGSTSAPGNFYQANEFTASVTAAVTEVDLGISLVTGTNSVTVELRTDNSGVPGSLLESYGFVGLGPFGSQNGPLIATSVTNPTLVAGTNYWMVVLPGASDTWAVWNWNDQSVTGNGSFSSDGGATWSNGSSETLGAFEVFGGTAVPAPSTLVMSSILFGMGGVLFGYKRRTKPAAAA
jgi:hypothetical protein